MRLIEQACPAAGKADYTGDALPSLVTNASYDILRSNLESYGNRLSDDHCEALRQIVGMFSRLASGQEQGRFAFGLPTGCGKTQAAVAWCQAVHELGAGYSVAIAASKVEALCDIRRALLAGGIPEGSIGLLHSKAFDPAKTAAYEATRDPEILGDAYASCGATADNERRQFLLVSHNRVRSLKAGNRALFDSYQGEPRSLVLWDESLLASSHRTVSKLDIERGLGWLRPGIVAASPAATALAYLDSANETFGRELEAQKAGALPTTIRLPDRTEVELAGYAAALGKDAPIEPLKALLDISQRDLRIVLTDQEGGACVTYQIVVPEELRNIAILDASWPIRELERMDKTIKEAPTFNGNVKLYDKVTINHLQFASGRRSMTKAFQQKREDRAVSMEIVEAIRSIPEDQGVIVFTFKATGKGSTRINFKDILKDDLRAAGIDTGALLPGSAKPRFAFLTWGMETSLSEFSYCSNVVFAGVLHRSHVDLSGAIIGQRDNLTGELSWQNLRAVERSEVAHSLYQAMSRGSCRMIEDGQAKGMAVWLIHHDPLIKDSLEAAMPGVSWRPWRGSYLRPYGAAATSIASAVMGYLRGLGEDETRISTRKLKEALGLTDTPARTFTNAMSIIDSEDQEWKLRGRSFVRGAEAFGFPSVKRQPLYKEMSY